MFALLRLSRLLTSVFFNVLVAKASLASGKTVLLVDAPATPISAAQKVKIVLGDSSLLQIKGDCLGNVTGIRFEVFSRSVDGAAAPGYWSDWCARIDDAEGKILTAVYGSELCMTRWANAPEGASAQEKALAMSEAPSSSQRRHPDVHSCLAAIAEAFSPASDDLAKGCCALHEDRDRTPQEMLGELSKNFSEATLAGDI